MSITDPIADMLTIVRNGSRAKKEKVDLLLAVGGGSVLDATKFIAAAIKYEGSDPWESPVGKDFRFDMYPGCATPHV